MPTKTGQDATLYKGKDYTIKFTEADAEDLTNFNGLTYAFADSRHADSNHFEKTKSGGGITISGSSNEVAEVSVDSTDTDGLTAPAEYYHELETEDANGNEQVAAEGTVELKPSRTN